jgi:16S rRNA (adenine1518-N6/adenine1519-N6)-dimethyltransferase
MSVIANKQFGQNFLIDNNVIQKILNYIQWGDRNLEIGPGRCAFTAEIMKLTSNLTLIEIDKSLIPEIRFKCGNEINLINDNCLKCNLNYDVIFSSLPYNISSEFILKLCTETQYKRCYLILQKEFVDRLIAMHNNKTYGALSVVIQLSAEVKFLRNISKTCFRPIPQVESAFASFTFQRTLTKDFVNFVFKCFAQRRKKLSNVVNVKCELRADQMPPKDFLSLYEEHRASQC